MTLAVRPFRDEDEPAVLELLRASLGEGPTGERSRDFFRWKHRHNPFGPSFMLLAEADGAVVGLRAFMRWRFHGAGGPMHAVRAVDTATHPDHQGRGVFSRLTREAVEALRGSVDLVFNTPNRRSGPGYLKLGWRRVGKVPASVRVRRPFSFLRGVASLRGSPPAPSEPPEIRAAPAAEALADDDRVAGLLERSAGDEFRLHTPVEVGYLWWRYASAPGLAYHAVVDEVGGQLRGLAIFRVRARGPLWESSVVEAIVPPADRRTAGRLLGAVADSAPVDHLTCLFPGGSAPARAAMLRGFVPSPARPVFMVNPLRSGLRPDPSQLRSWALRLGDVEVF